MMDTASVATVAPSTTSPLTSLPPELLDATLALLPVRKLYRMRGLCRFLKEYIDDNEEALLKRTIAYNRARLIKRGEALSSTTFLEGLKQCCSYYGLPEDAELFHTVFKTLADRCRKEGTQSVDRVRGAYFAIGLRSGLHDYNEVESQNINKLKAGLEWDARLDPAITAELIEAINHMHLDVVKGPRYTEKYGRPKHFLTHRMLGVRTTICGACEDIPDVIGVPAFPKRYAVSKRDLAYCAKSKAAWCIAADAKAQGLKTLPLFKQAALLEEAFVW